MAAQIAPACVARMGQEENAADPAADQEITQLGAVAEEEAQLAIISQRLLAGGTAPVPLRQEGEGNRQLGYKNARRWPMLLMLFFSMAPFYQPAAVGSWSGVSSLSNGWSILANARHFWAMSKSPGKRPRCAPRRSRRPPAYAAQRGLPSGPGERLGHNATTAR